MRRTRQRFAGIFSGILAGLLYYFATAFVYENFVFFGFELKATASILFLLFLVLTCVGYLLIRKRTSAFAAFHLCASVITGAAFYIYMLTIRFFS